MGQIENKIADLARQLEGLKLAPETASSFQVTEGGSVLTARPILKEIAGLVGASTRQSSTLPAGGEPKPQERVPHPSCKPPVQPMFNGKDFRLFLERHKR